MTGIDDLPAQTLHARMRRAASAVMGRPRAMIEPGIELYADEMTSPESPALLALAEDSRRETERPFMMSGQTQGEFLATLVHMSRPRHVLEIGTFTGYAALAMAAALPPGGRLTTCEIDPHHAGIAARHFAASPHADVIDLVVGPALDTVASLPGPFDLVFIDADKAGYLAYVEAVLPKLSPHGVIAVDNTLHNGLVAHDALDQEMIDALTGFNSAVRADPRVDQVVLTIRDGVTLIRPRQA